MRNTIRKAVISGLFSSAFISVIICLSFYHNPNAIALPMHSVAPFDGNSVELLRSDSREIIRVNSKDFQLIDIHKHETFSYNNLLRRGGLLLWRKNFFLDEQTSQLFFCDYSTGIYLLLRGKKKLVFPWGLMKRKLNQRKSCFCTYKDGFAFVEDSGKELLFLAVDSKGEIVHTLTIGSLGYVESLFFHRESGKFFFKPWSKTWVLLAIDIEKDLYDVLKEKEEKSGNCTIRTLDANHIFVDGFIVNVNDYSFQWGAMRTMIVNTSGFRIPYRLTKKIEYAQGNIFVGFDYIEMINRADFGSYDYEYTLKISLYRFIGGKLTVCSISEPQKLAHPSLGEFNSIIVSPFEKYLICSCHSASFVVDLSTLVATDIRANAVIRNNAGVFYLTPEKLLCHSDFCGDLLYAYSTSFSKILDIASLDDELYILADGFLYSQTSFSNAKLEVICKTEAKQIAVNSSGVLLITEDNVSLRFFDVAKGEKFVLSHCSNLQRSSDGNYLLYRRKSNQWFTLRVSNLISTEITTLPQGKHKAFSMLISLNEGTLELRLPYSGKLYKKLQLPGVTAVLDYWNGTLLVQRGTNLVWIWLNVYEERELGKYNPKDKIFISGRGRENFLVSIPADRRFRYYI